MSHGTSITTGMRTPRAKRCPVRVVHRFRRVPADRWRRPREAYLTADYNAQKLEHIAEHPGSATAHCSWATPMTSSSSLRTGVAVDPDWTQRHFDFTGYVTGFDPADLGDRTRLRSELGYRDEELLCIVTVGGSGIGADLLRRVIDAFPQAKERVPELRMIVVAGPRIDPESLPGGGGGLEVVPYVPNLYRHLAACDLAVVQGGLTTSMELTANKRPFLYFPLCHHFEQNFHVRHRLERYRAGRHMDYDNWPAGADRRGDRRGDLPRGRLSRRGERWCRQGGAAHRRVAMTVRRYIPLSARWGWRTSWMSTKKGRSLCRPGLDSELKARHRAMWASGDYPDMVETSCFRWGRGSWRRAASVPATWSWMRQPVPATLRYPRLRPALRSPPAT